MLCYASLVLLLVQVRILRTICSSVADADAAAPCREFRYNRALVHLLPLFSSFCFLSVFFRLLLLFSDCIILAVPGAAWITAFALLCFASLCFALYIGLSLLSTLPYSWPFWAFILTTHALALKKISGFLGRFFASTCCPARLSRKSRRIQRYGQSSSPSPRSHALERLWTLDLAHRVPALLSPVPEPPW